jgi:hypothetical protein
MLVFLVWLKPTLFKVLLDKENNDYPSLGRQGQFTAMIVSTWLIVSESLQGTISEWMFGGYMLAFAGAQFGSAYLKIKGQTPGTATTTESSKTTTKTIEGEK